MWGAGQEDIDFGAQAIRLYTRKRKDGSEEFDWLHMTDELYDALLEHKQTSGDNVYVFTDPETGNRYINRQHWIKNMCRRAGVKRFCIHAIRHLSASILLQGDAPMGDIQAVLRHRRVSTTEGYIGKTRRVKAALAIISKLTQEKTTSNKTSRVWKEKGNVAKYL